MHRGLHITELKPRAMGLLRSAWARLTEEGGDSPDLALLLARAEGHALRARDQFAAMSCALRTGDTTRLLTDAAAMQTRAEAILRDVDRLRDLAETGSRSQLETSYLIRRILYGLAGRLDSISRELIHGGELILSEAFCESLRDSVRFAASTASLVRHVLEWEDEKSRLVSVHRHWALQEERCRAGSAAKSASSGSD